jgi:hypothetical protein
VTRGVHRHPIQDLREQHALDPAQRRAGRRDPARAAAGLRDLELDVA